LSTLAVSIQLIDFGLRATGKINPVQTTIPTNITT
jgi:hypothetical protein